jgi:hypothetical protein
MSSINEDLIDCHLIHPFTCTVVGGTMSGKTFFVVDLIKNRYKLCSAPLEKVVYIYCDYQPIFHSLESDPNIIFTNKIEDLENLITNQSLAIVDDQMDTISKHSAARDSIKAFFIKKAHHLGVSIICISQNMYADNFRDINRNANYNFFFDLQSDKAVLSWKGKQCCPSHPGFLIDAYQKALATRDFGYLLLEFHPRRKYKKYWARSHLEPTKEMQIYTPK